MALAPFLLSWVFVYLYWLRLRVIRLRFELWTIRRQLHRAARRIGALQDSRYIEARRLLNGLIGAAESYSFALIRYVARIADAQSEDSYWPNSPPLKEGIELHVDRALDEARNLIDRYIALHTLSCLVRPSESARQLVTIPMLHKMADVWISEELKSQERFAV